MRALERQDTQHAANPSVRRLAIAVILQAVNDAKDPKLSPEERRAAVQWLRRPSETLRLWADASGLDSNVVIELLGKKAGVQERRAA